MNTNKIIIKNAVLITLLIAGFFFLSKLFGLHDNPYLRFLNLVFVLYGTKLAITQNIDHNKETKFINNLGIGLQTSVLSVIFSIIGVIAYIEFINPSFLEVMNRSFLIGGDLSLAEVFISLLIEGMASSLIASFIVMMYYKNYNKVLLKA